MGARKADFGFEQYWFAYLAAQRMSFLRFLVYGWFLGIPGWFLFTLLSPFAWFYFVFYTFSFRDGGKVTKRWHKFNTRRAFGAHVKQVDRDDIERTYEGE